ncbi:MAG: ThiF family adenylyltransferase [Acidimicrobiia bacterium]
MSATPISRSPDLKRLRDEGYHVEIRAEPAHLLVHDVPYVAPDRTVKRGTLVSTLALAGDITTTPDTHVVTFSGDTPCDQHGQPLTSVINGSQRQELAPGLVIDHTFSSKPPNGYPDYFAKMTTYANILTGYAEALDATATARTYPVVEDEDVTSVFNYLDTATSRSGIGAVTDKLNVPSVAIVGLGGTGSYVLDLIAKTPIQEIHLFDGDVLLQHGAFRSPGAPTIDTLRVKPFKVDYFKDLYRPLRGGIVTHPEYLDESNVDDLASMDFVFVCVDDGEARALIVDALERGSVPFIDVGMGVHETAGSLGGIIRITTSTESNREEARRHLPLRNADADNAYVSNIQIADLNALNAALAVIRWKKHCDFYRDLRGEHHSCYTIDGNLVTNESIADEA